MSRHIVAGVCSSLFSIGIKYNLLIAINFQLYRSYLGILHHKERNVCDQCGQKFAKYEDLISHARHSHRHPIVKCHECGKEFIHEKDRLHHTREEHKKKVESRQLKNLNQREE
jgi:hypothetical protein